MCVQGGVVGGGGVPGGLCVCPGGRGVWTQGGGIPACTKADPPPP